jgi:putative FmdB family regulatory protein
MPIYEYRCRGCGKDFEKYVPGVSTKVACPTCASGDITRKLSVFGLGIGANPSPVASSMSSGGGCCGGGGCGCH